MKDEYIQELKKTWDELGKEGPFGAILTPYWDERKPAEFFETGVKEIKEIMKIVEQLEARFQDIRGPRISALDFGCGIGRLTQALAEYFDEVHGVDIAPSMIDKAIEYNTHGDKCTYHLNESDDLALFPDNRFDFIYSSVVLMHIEPKYAGSYMQELIRVLAPRGILIFQCLSMPKLSPTESESMSRVIKHLAKIATPEVLLHSIRKMRYESIRQKTEKPVIEMYWKKRKKVERILEKGGAKILKVIEDRIEWPDWVSCKYCVTK